MPIPAGTVLESYEIQSALGSGGMGVVYRAYDLTLQRTVAIKVLGDGSDVPDEASRERLLHEARAASALNHPNICVIHEVGEFDGRAFIVMEYVDGPPLNELIPKGGLPREAALRYGAQVADALAHAHERGIVHRDLKSANVMVGKDGRARVVDFGLAKRVTQSPVDLPTSSKALSVDVPFGGTLSHMAPEVLRGGAPTVASDLWAFGVLLFELVSGELPFSGRTQFDLTAAILHDAPSPMPANTPPSLRMIVARCLAREPRDRYASAGEVHAALQAVQSDSTLPAGPPLVARQRAIPAAAWGLTGLVAVVGAAAWLNIRTGQVPQLFPRDPGRLALLVSSEQRAFDPAVSPDGKMFAFVAQNETDRLDLYVARVAGGGRVQLTDDDAVEGHPQFSPDGERILFHRRGQDTGRVEIRMVPTLGGEASVVLRDGAYPAWSPDGSRIAFIQAKAQSKASGLAIARIDGSDVRSLLMADALYPFLRYPAWSPDGETIAVVRGSGGIAGDIWLQSTDGGPARRLTSDENAVFSDQPAFTSDGRFVVHSSNRGGATNIWALPIDGGSPTRLTTGPGPDESPTVATTGEVAFVNSRWRNGLFVHDIDRGDSRLLLTHSPFLWAPAFSPDGRELAFSRGEVDGQWHIWLISTAGGTARQLTSGALGEVYATFTADGRSILYHTWNAPRRIWQLPRAGGPAVPLTADGMDATFGELSPDGRALVFVVTEEGKGERVYTQPAQGGSPQLLTASSASTPRWSPDGEWIAFAADRGYGGGISIIRPGGGQERRLTETGGWPAWRSDGRHISYAVVTPDGRQQIETVAIDGAAAATPVGFRFEGTNFPFVFSSNGRTMATSNSIHLSDEIWLLQPEE